MSDSDTQRPGNVLAGSQLYNNRYRVDMLLSVQSTRAVYRGFDLQQNKPVTILEMITLEHLRIQSALQNAHPLVELQHPSISTIQAAFFENNLFFLTFTIPGGQMLTNILKERHDPIPESTAFRWIMQILEMLIFLETQTPDWHFGDLSPESIFITSEDRAQMLGFEIPLGLFEPWEMAADLPTGAVAPEMFENICSAASDVYGVAVTLYYLLTNIEHRSDSSQHIALMRPDLSLKLTKVIEKGYAEDSNERWQDPARFYDELLKTLPKDRSAAAANAADTTVTLADLEEDSPTLVTNKDQMRAAIEAEAAKAALLAQTTTPTTAEPAEFNDETSQEAQTEVPEHQYTPEAKAQQPQEHTGEHIAEAGAAVGDAFLAGDILQREESHTEDAAEPVAEPEADSANDTQPIEAQDSDTVQSVAQDNNIEPESIAETGNENDIPDTDTETPAETESESLQQTDLVEEAEPLNQELHTSEEDDNIALEPEPSAGNAITETTMNTEQTEETAADEESQTVQENSGNDEIPPEEHSSGAGAYIAGGLLGAGAAALAAFALRDKQPAEHGHIINTPQDNSAAQDSGNLEEPDALDAATPEDTQDFAEAPSADADASLQEPVHDENGQMEPEDSDAFTHINQDDEFADEEEEPQNNLPADSEQKNQTNSQEEQPPDEWPQPQQQKQFPAETAVAAAGLSIAALPLTKAAAKPSESLWGKFRALLQGSQTAAISIATISLPKQMVAHRQYHILARVQSQPLDKTRNHPNFLAIEVDAAQDVFYMPAQRVAIRLPSDGGISEGSLMITAQRPTEGHKLDRIIFRITTPDGEVVHTGKNYVAECKIVDDESEVTDNSYVTLTHGLDLM